MSGAFSRDYLLFSCEASMTGRASKLFRFTDLAFSRWPPIAPNERKRARCSSSKRNAVPLVQLKISHWRLLMMTMMARDPSSALCLRTAMQCLFRGTIFADRDRNHPLTAMSPRPFIFKTSR